MPTFDFIKPICYMTLCSSSAMLQSSLKLYAIGICNIADQSDIDHRSDFYHRILELLLLQYQGMMIWSDQLTAISITL